MRWRLTLLVLCSLLPSLATYAQDVLKKTGQRVRVVRYSKRGAYRLSKPLRGRGFFIEGSGPNEGFLLGYSLEGDLDRALEHPLFLALLDAYDNQVVPPSYSVLPAGLKSSVDPLLTDHWNQPEPYNICAPMVEGKHCVVGCVALAMSQVMRYWRWPKAGTGMHSYLDSLGCGETLSADFAHEYKWDLMRDVYEGPVDSSDVGLLEAGRLMRDCGVAVEMRYGLEASAARSVNQAIALTTWFGYDQGMQLYYRDFFSRAEWESMLAQELSAGRPVLFAAQSASLSHALVCDGYDEDGLFHMNFGLGGDADGYYYLPHLTPKQPIWYDPESAERGLNLLQSMIVGVRPAEPLPVVRHSLGMAFIEPVCAKSSRSGEVSVATSHLANLGWNTVDEGSVWLVLLRGEDVVEKLVGYPHGFSREELTDSTYSDTLSFSLAGAVAEGRYRICPALLEPNGEWTLARASMGTPSHVFLDVTKDSLSLSADTCGMSRLELLSWEFPDSVCRNQISPFSFTLRNEGPSEYCGRLSILLHEARENGRMRPLQYQGMWLAPGQEVTYTYRFTPVPLPEGDYELCLAYDNNLFTDSLVWLAPFPLQQVKVCPPAPTSVSGVDMEAEVPAACYELDGLPMRENQPGIGVWRQGKKSRKILIK